MKTKVANDVEIENCGSVVLFRALSKAAHDWIAEHVHPEEWMWLGNGLAVDPHCAVDLAVGMESDGLVVA